ncbi:hypothetical protein D3C86_1599210 [compost metagenome]
MTSALLSAVTLAALTGCSSAGSEWRARSEVFSYGDRDYEQRRVASEIQVFEGELPAKPYVRLAKIVSEPIFGSTQDTFLELKRRAAMMGADAIIDLKFDVEEVEYGKATETTRESTYFGSNRAEKRSVKEINKPATGKRTIISGVAIRYKAASEQ